MRTEEPEPQSKHNQRRRLLVHYLQLATNGLPLLGSLIAYGGSLLWAYLLEVSGENDYSRYRARVVAQGEPPVTASEFYMAQLERKYSRVSRCC